MSTGSGSSFPLGKLVARYLEMQEEPRLLTLRPALAVVRHRVTQLMDRLKTNETPERINKLRELWKQHQEADDLARIKIAMDLDAEFERAYHDYESWKQILDALNLEGKLATQELQIVKEIRAIMTAEEGAELTAKLMAAVIKVVDDPIKIKRIQYEFGRIIGVGTAPDDGGDGRNDVIEVRPRELAGDQLLDS